MNLSYLLFFLIVMQTKEYKEGKEERLLFLLRVFVLRVFHRRSERVRVIAVDTLTVDSLDRECYLMQGRQSANSGVVCSIS